jgi:hypothetical protein
MDPTLSTQQRLEYSDVTKSTLPKGHPGFSPTFCYEPQNRHGSVPGLVAPSLLEAIANLALSVCGRDTTSVESLLRGGAHSNRSSHVRRACAGHESTADNARFRLPRAHRLIVPRRYSLVVFGVLQSGLTCAVASAIASLSLVHSRTFFAHWTQSWLVSWATMIPVVLFASPFLRRVVDAVTKD